MTISPLPPGASASLRLNAPDLVTLSELRTWVRNLASPSGDLELLLTELVSNAKEHGEEGPITVEVERHEQSVTLVVTNPCPAPPPSIVASPIVDVTSVRGRGLSIASALTEDLRIEQSDNTLKISAVVPLPATLS